MKRSKLIKPTTARVVCRRLAGTNHAVLTVKGGNPFLQRNVPCAQCPWRVDAVGVFPAQAFKHSAPVAYDMADSSFACHDSGSKRPAICAGFLLRNANNNLAVRLKVMRGEIDLSAISDHGLALFDDYRAMAVANGVDPDDPVLRACRGNSD